MTLYKTQELHNDMKNFAERLKMARIKNGWSMQDLADRLDGHISKSAIAKYEKGEREPGRDKLLMLSDALMVRIDYFFREGKLEFNPKFRKLAKLPQKKQAEVIEKTRDYLERFLEAEELVAEEKGFVNKIKDFVCDDLQKAEEAADLFRSEMKLGDDPLYNIVELLEDWGIKVYHDVLGDDSISGLSSWIDRDKGIAVIVINKSHKIDRQRFTALHELGHLVLNIPDHLTDKEEERICDRFAGAMLIPSHRLQQELGPHRNRIHLKELELIKAQYGISPMGILYRAKDHGIISDHLHRSMIITLRKRYDYKEEIGFYEGTERSGRLLQVLCKGIAEDAITTSKAASLYGVTLSSFRKELGITLKSVSA